MAFEQHAALFPVIRMPVFDQRMSRVLVTGASGFVGSALAAELTKWSIPLRLCSRSSVMSIESVDFVRIDTVSGDTDWSEALLGINTIIHLAARVHVMHDTAADPLTAFREVNLHGTFNLALQAAAAGVRRFVYVSSIKVNGECTDEKPFAESDVPMPQDPYGISKWEAEQAIHAISRETGMEIVIIRPPLVYGPGVKANFYQLLDMVNKSLPLPLGSINNRRSMIYVENLVDALILCATHPAAAGQTYLVSDDAAISTPELVRVLASAMQRPCRVFPFPFPIMQLCAGLLGKSSVLDRLTQSLEVDSSKIRRELGWELPYTMQQGLQATAEWFARSKNTKKAD
jgi:nucleoside-diphosphate-sugar epimerase